MIINVESAQNTDYICHHKQTRTLYSCFWGIPRFSYLNHILHSYQTSKHVWQRHEIYGTALWRQCTSTSEIYFKISLIKNYFANCFPKNDNKTTKQHNNITKQNGTVNNNIIINSYKCFCFLYFCILLSIIPFNVTGVANPFLLNIIMGRK